MLKRIEGLEKRGIRQQLVGRKLGERIFRVLDKEDCIRFVAVSDNKCYVLAFFERKYKKSGIQEAGICYGKIKNVGRRCIISPRQLLRFFSKGSVCNTQARKHLRQLAAEVGFTYLQS